jgi:membrane protease YdiL (CAAX protease family)
MVGTILVVILVLFLLGALPVHGYSAHWGPWPAGGVGLLVIVVIIILLFRGI